jgi:SpoIID/LytB domain protein
MFKQIQFKNSNRRRQGSRVRQNLPAVICLFLCVFGLFTPQLFGLSKKKPPVRFEFDRQIRVWLGTFDSLAVNSSGEMIIECYRNGERAEIYYTSSSIDIFKTKKGNRHIGGLSIRDNNGILALKLSAIRFRPRFPNVFLDFGDKYYRGNIECLVDLDNRPSESSSKIEVFNLVDIEEYLKGVLPGEIGKRSEDEFEAVKAQAIAARTYAVWRLSSKLNNKHLKNSIDDQLYLGAGAELPLLNKGVEQTEGLVMTIKGFPIAAYYHAVCGGSTAPVEKIWGGKKIGYLRGTVDGDYCQWAKTYFWTEKYSMTDLTESLSRYLSQNGQLPRKGFGKLMGIKFEEDYSIGRNVEMNIKTSTGDFTVFSDQIRWALRRPSVPGVILPSTRFKATIEKEKGEIKSMMLVGAGNGHGVGMCQCGAIGRARAGQSCMEILETYYKGIQIEKIY